MTKVKFSGVGITAMSGATGETVTTRNFYGSYQKMRIGGPASPSPALLAWNGVFSFLHAGYEALSDSDRNKWIAAARSPVYQKIDALADKMPYTGFHLYMKLNLPLMLVSGIPISIPPLHPTLPPVLQAVSYLPSSPTKDILWAPPSVFCFVAIYATPNLNAGRMSNNQIYGFIKAAFSGPGGTTTSAAWSAKYGARVSGKKVFYKIVSVNNLQGTCSLPQYVSGINP